MPTNQYIRSIPPINSQVWAFSIGGLVRHPLILSYADLVRQPSVTLPVSVICTDRRSIDSANYTAVPLSALFDLVELREGAQYVTMHAYDGYSTALSLFFFRYLHAHIAYSIDGQPLTHDQGFPARLVVPGYYGYKMPKWITRLEVTAEEQLGFWESRGFDRSGRLLGMIEFAFHEVLEDGTIRLHGVAYSGRSTDTEAVEIYVDRGTGTKFPLSPNQRHWQVDWTPPYANGVFQFDAGLISGRYTVSYSSRPYIVRT